VNTMSPLSSLPTWDSFLKGEVHETQVPGLL